MSPKKQPRVARQITRQLDELIANARVAPLPRKGWVAAIRQALGMSKTALARRLGSSRQNLDALEKNEINDTITLASLRKVAAALDCELQYMLVPQKPLGEMISEQAKRQASKKLNRVNQSQALEASTLEADTLTRAVNDLAVEYEVTRPTGLWND